MQSMQAKQDTVDSKLANIPRQEQLLRLEQLLKQLEDKQCQKHAELSNEGTLKVNELRTEVTSQLVNVKAFLEMVSGLF